MQNLWIRYNGLAQWLGTTSVFPTRENLAHQPWHRILVPYSIYKYAIAAGRRCSASSLLLVNLQRFYAHNGAVISQTDGGGTGNGLFRQQEFMASVRYYLLYRALCPHIYQPR